MSSTNVLIDVLAKREPFYADSARIWTLAEQGRIVHTRVLELWGAGD